ncbi:hypothetical protein BGZ82_005909 [Podila clonocystis]|nr:hypothetical protein BGZ82_005909 [Podila clonocystis]
MPPGTEDWVSGIEHICVGDSLVACSTEFSGSVLVFSLATGSLVYEIPEGKREPRRMHKVMGNITDMAKMLIAFATINTART